MRVIITGSSGFAGRYLRGELEGRGHDVFGMDMTTGLSQYEAGRFFQADITDTKAVNEAVNSIMPDYVFHLAAVSYVDFKNPELMYRVNVGGTLNVLNACLMCGSDPGVLLVSSSQVYGAAGDKGRPITEGTPPEPVNHYGASKAAAERIAFGYAGSSGLKLVVARPFNHTGKGQEEHFVVPKLVKAFRERSDSISLGNIDTVRDFCDVRDVVRAYALLMEKGVYGKAVNICSSEGVTIRQVIRMLEELTSHKMSLDIKEEFIRKNEITCSIGSNRAIKDIALWSPGIKFEDTLAWMLGL